MSGSVLFNFFRNQSRRNDIMDKTISYIHRYEKITENPEKIYQIVEQFNKADVNKDSMLSMGELVEYFAKSGATYNMDDVKEAWKHVDKNRDQ
jgi:Ca2+-binding EF-hand superfamily protein